MKKSSCARAYFKGGCATYSSFYTDRNVAKNVCPAKFVVAVEAFAVKKGCTLTLFSENNLNGTEKTISGEYQEVNLISS